MRRLLLPLLLVSGSFALTAPASAATTLRATLTGAEEVPKRGDGNGRGTARVTIDRGRRRLCWSISVSRIDTVVAGHIHKGRRGTAGTVMVDLRMSGSARSGCVRPAAPILRDIVRAPRGFYVNVHTKRFPSGAVRGQLRR